jgi:methionyl-tRNA formyltransferase
MSSNNTKLRIAFMGTPEFSVPTLQSLISFGHDIRAVYTQPPRPAGRGKKNKVSPVQSLAELNGLTVKTPHSLKTDEEQEYFEKLGLDAAIVVAYGLILPKTFLEAPRLGCINIHASLLPRWRGAAPIQRAIMAGDTKTGVTIMQMDEQLDTGPIFTTNELEITDQTTSETLHRSMANLGACIINKTLKDINRKNLRAIEQSTSGISYADKLSRDEGYVDWNKSAEEIEKLVRALYPWPGAWTEIDGSRIKIFESKVIPASKQTFPPGTIIDNKLTISCGRNSLRLVRLQKQGKKIMNTEEYLNGNPISKGTNLS